VGAGVLYGMSLLTAGRVQLKPKGLKRR
jgi:hypothetical protein